MEKFVKEKFRDHNKKGSFNFGDIRNIGMARPRSAGLAKSREEKIDSVKTKDFFVNLYKTT